MECHLKRSEAFILLTACSVFPEHDHIPMLFVSICKVLAFAIKYSFNLSKSNAGEFVSYTTPITPCTATSLAQSTYDCISLKFMLAKPLMKITQGRRSDAPTGS